MKEKTEKYARKGECALCGEERILSFEHVPPRAAFNDKPIFMQNHEHLLDEKSYLYGKKSLSRQGFGAYTLCETCNNNTGGWYGNAFVDFARQGMSIIKAHDIIPYGIKGTYRIKPLNVIKQILTMFMSADKSSHLRSQQDLVNFILDKEQTGLPNRYKIFLYSTLSTTKRLIGYSISFDMKTQKPQKWSEINFQPFGYLLAEESDSAHEDMVDISQFGEARYDQVFTVDITTPYLRVESLWIGTYVN